MTRTVDLIVSGDGSAALAAVANAIHAGQCVLVVLRCGGRRAVQRFRDRLRQATEANSSRLSVLTNAEVVCVDGVAGVEAVVIRHARTGHLYAVNASAFLSCSGSTWTAESREIKTGWDENPSVLDQRPARILRSRVTSTHK